MTKITVDGFSIERKLGEGSMNEVFLGRNQEGQAYALKILKSFLKDQKDVIRRIQKEADVLSIMKDNRIVKLFDCVETTDGRPVLIQEFIDGKNLSELMKRDKQVPHPMLGCLIVSEILLGLEEAHSNGIIHRDLKPENVMLTASGEVKITDFGIAKNLDSDEVTMTGILLGSPAYMSPEQAQGSDVNEASDIFALGVFLYKFCTGGLPFSRKNFTSTISAIVKGEYLSPEKINPRLHPKLVSIIKKALSGNIEDRYQKVYDFRYDLLKVIEIFRVKNIRRALKSYYLGENSIDYDESELVQTLITRASQAISTGNRKEGLNLVNQLMNVDPSNDEGQKLLRSTQIQKQSPALFIALILLSLTALSFGAYTYQEQLLSLINSDETDEVKQSQAAIKKEDLIKKQIQGIQQTEVQKAADFKKVTKQKRKTEVKKKAKKKAKKIVKS
jgi:serine/threonine protein kinase